MKPAFLALALLAAGAPAVSAQPKAPPPACTAPEHRQFDFWIGRWEVTDLRTGAHAGSSLIESLYGGCVLRENWSQQGWAGGSLNIYSEAEKRWRQTWVDQSGSLREFKGGLEGGRMVLVAEVAAPGAQGGKALVRMTFTPNPDGSVRQYSDISKDGGSTWAPRYDFFYRRAP